jgi:hypothetical protein
VAILPENESPLKDDDLIFVIEAGWIASAEN